MTADDKRRKRNGDVDYLNDNIKQKHERLDMSYATTDTH